MAFPSDPSLSVEFERVKSAASQAKRNAQNDRASMAAGPVSWSFVLALLNNLRVAKERFDHVAALGPDMSAYAEAQQGRNLDADFAAVQTALDDAIQHIVSVIPKDGSGRLLVQTFDADGTVQDVTFSSAATAQTRAYLDAILITIE